MSNKKIMTVYEPVSIDDLDILDVLKEEFNISAANLNGEIVLPEGTEMPSDDDLLLAKQNLLLKYENTAYFRKRKVSYPSLKIQLDALYHDIVNNKLNEAESEFVKIIRAVKEQYPKTEE